MATASCLPENRIGLPPPFLMWRIGPTLYVEIGFDAEYEAGHPGRPNVPSTIYPALVDTGARDSCIDTSIAQALNLPIEAERQISGTSGTHASTIYRAQVYIPVLGETISGEFYGVVMTGGGHYQRAIIGRDFLLGYVLHYDGRTGEVTISNE